MLVKEKQTAISKLPERRGRSLSKLRDPALGVLIADDQAIVRIGLIKLMRENFDRLRIMEAGAFGAALAILERKDIAMVILDLNWPGLCNPFVLSTIRQKRPDLKILVLTASKEQEDMFEAS